MLEIKFLFGEWIEATREEAESFYKTFCDGATAIKGKDRQKYFNEHHIRGGHIMANGKVETTEEQKERVFNHYKNRLTTEVAGKTGILRFNCIEYLCGFPEIDPFAMAASITKEGIVILYDDSSISRKENKKKERKVNKLIV